MSTITSLRRAGTAVVASALAVSLAGAAGAADATSGRSTHAAQDSRLIPPSPALTGSGDWLADQLRHGLIHNAQFKFDDYGLTADTAFALSAVGQHDKKVQAARTALSQHATDYTGAKKNRFAGALGKLLVLAQTTGGGETDFGGINLVRRAAERVSTTAPIAGRIEDKSAFGDFANVLGQVFVTRGLLAAGDPAGDSALTFLLRQQCPAGYFRLDFTKSKTTPKQGCRASSASDLDVTALAVIELSDQAGAHPTLTPALADATAWLLTQQKADGSFRGGTTTSPKNTNSTGLAGTALFDSGDCISAQKAARWVRDRQVNHPSKHSPLVGEKGAIAYNDAALDAGRKHGIDKTTRDQWRRASAQAAPSLVALTCPA